MRRFQVGGGCDGCDGEIRLSLLLLVVRHQQWLIKAKHGSPRPVFVHVLRSVIGFGP